MVCVCCLYCWRCRWRCRRFPRRKSLRSPKNPRSPRKTRAGIKDKKEKDKKDKDKKEKNKDKDKKKDEDVPPIAGLSRIQAQDRIQDAERRLRVTYNAVKYQYGVLRERAQKSIWRKILR